MSARRVTSRPLAREQIAHERTASGRCHRFLERREDRAQRKRRAPYFATWINGHTAVAATAKTMLATNQPLKSLCRSTDELTRTTKITNHKMNISGIFWRLPSQHATATPIHHAGCLRASCAKRIASVVKNARPISRRARPASDENNGQQTRIAMVSGTSHGRSGAITRTRQASVIALKTA